jgi:putative tail fiber assembly protein
MYLLNIIDKDGHFELIDSDFIALYNVDKSTLIELTDAQYQQYLAISSDDITFKDGAFHARPLRPSEEHEWDGKAWVISPTKMTALLQEQREIIRTKINQLRDEKTAGGVYVASIGKWFDSDDKARANVIELKAAFDVLGDEVVPWTTYENDVVMMDHEKMKALFKELKDSKLHNHQTATQHKLALEQSTDPLNYDYSTGWSKTYADQEN